MILELRLSNIFSLRDEVTLSMQAAKIQTPKAKAKTMPYPRYRTRATGNG